MTDASTQSPAQRLAAAYALWSESRGTMAQQWIALFADTIEMRSVLTPDLPDDLAATRRNLSAALEYSRRCRAIGRCSNSPSSASSTAATTS